MWGWIYLAVQVWWWLSLHAAVTCGLGSFLRNREHSTVLKVPLTAIDRSSLFLIAVLWPITLPIMFLNGLHRRWRREATSQELMDETIGYVCQKFRRDYQCPVCLHRWESDEDIPAVCPECDIKGVLPVQGRTPRPSGNIWS